METVPNILKDAKRLPSIDWKLSFFGGHTQIVDNTWKVEKNKHFAFELIYVIQGQELILIDNVSYSLETNEFLIIPPNYPHEIKVGDCETLHYFCAHFDIDDPEFVTELINYGDRKLTPKDTLYPKFIPVIYQWLQLIQNEAVGDFEKKLTIQILLSNFLILLNELIEYNKQKYQLKYANKANLKYAKQISQNIQHQLHEIWAFDSSDTSMMSITDISIASIIESIGINAAYGSTLFKQVYGISPKKYCSALILEEAKNLLNIHSLSIEEISEKLHFHSLAHFSKQFKRWTKLSPSQYRAKYYPTLNVT